LFWTPQKWKDLWANQTRPRHAQDNPEFYRSFASEINVILYDLKRDAVLEIGCGNGALFPYLLVKDSPIYTGVDVSATMIADFQQRYPDLNLKVVSGESYADNTRYDLIFSVGVVQHFTKEMLAEHIEKSAAMLNSGGHILCAQIPWLALRYWYGEGTVIGAKNSGWLRYLKSRVSMARHGFMGRWYDHREFSDLARRHGLTAKFFGSMHYPYRFHVLLSKSR